MEIFKIRGIAVLTVIVPVFNDWQSFGALLRDLDDMAVENGLQLRVIVSDDGSSDPAPEDLRSLGPLHNIESVLHIELAVNLGHQRALAVGICAALQEPPTPWLVMMDADGEDRPRDIPILLQCCLENPKLVAVAQRRRRSEPITFRIFYQAYKAAFRLLTGKAVSFGNFSMMCRENAERLSMQSELWNNLPAAIMRSKIPIHRVPIDRGKRYFGSSKMSFVQLTLHGISAYSVYTDAILVRLLIVTFVLAIAGAALSILVLALRIFVPAYATPGWATTVTFGSAIIVSQVMFTTLMTALLLLNSRTQRQLIPAIESLHYIRSRRLIPFQAAGPRESAEA
jgi:glycosyltransferase involved in cell wall biosynthesis